jgi:hypothetical protein
VWEKSDMNSGGTGMAPAYHPSHSSSSASRVGWAMLSPDLMIGVESLVLVYRRFSRTAAGEMSAELFVLDEAGKVVRSISHYLEATP